jgi:hypothetical protein
MTPHEPHVPPIPPPTHADARAAVRELLRHDDTRKHAEPRPAAALGHHVVHEPRGVGLLDHGPRELPRAVVVRGDGDDLVPRKGAREVLHRPRVGVEVKGQAVLRRAAEQPPRGEARKGAEHCE